MKTKELTGADLNRAVAMALGLKLILIEDPVGKVGVLGLVFAWKIDTGLVEQSRHEGKTYICPIYEALPDYAGDIAAAWPVIEKLLPSFARNKFGLFCQIDVSAISPTHQLPRHVIRMHGSTLIEAAMRCFVHSVYGDDINLEDV